MSNIENTEKKKIGLIAGIVILILVISGGVYYFLNSGNKEPIKNINSGKVAASNTDKKTENSKIKEHSGSDTTIDMKEPVKKTEEDKMLETKEDTNLPNVITGDNNMTLYTYTKDEYNVSNCEGECLKEWTIYFNDKLANKGFSTFVRKDGKKQTSLNGNPLYYYSKDKKAGDMLGDKKDGFWNVINKNDLISNVNIAPSKDETINEEERMLKDMVKNLEKKDKTKEEKIKPEDKKETKGGIKNKEKINVIGEAIKIPLKYRDVVSEGIEVLNAKGLDAYGITPKSVIEDIINSNLREGKNVFVGSEIKSGGYTIVIDKNYIITKFKKGDKELKNTPIIGKSLFDIDNLYK